MNASVYDAITSVKTVRINANHELYIIVRVVETHCFWAAGIATVLLSVLPGYLCKAMGSVKYASQQL